MVRKDLQRNDVQQPLQAIDCPGNTDCLAIGRNGFVSVVAEHNGLCFTSSNLSIGRLDLGVEGVLSHDDEDRHIFINKSQRSMFELASEDTCQQ